MLHQQLVLGPVQHVVHRAFAQSLGLATTIGKLVRVKNLARLKVKHIELATHKRLVHLVYRRVERLVRQHCNTQNQPLRAIIDLAGTLVAKLAAD